MARIVKSSEIQALMEKKLKSRRKVNLVCVLLLLTCLERFGYRTRSKDLLLLPHIIVKSVASSRSQCIVAGYAFEPVFIFEEC
jgi:uncharacterized membrane protein